MITDKTDLLDPSQGNYESIETIEVTTEHTVNDVIEELLKHELCGPHCGGLQTMSDRDYHTLTWVARETWDSDKLVQLDPWEVYNMQMHELIANKDDMWPHLPGDDRAHSKIHI